MHLTKIEEYNFTHGLHFNNQTGEYYSLNPHTLGRALTHEEMDYNLIYQKQTLNGFRIAGSATDLTLTANDLGFTLVYAQISTGDADWNRYQAAGLFDGQFVWIPKALATTTTTTTIAPSYDTFTASTANVNEGDVVSFNLSTTNIADGTTVGYTINGVSGADIGGVALTGNLTISGNQSALVLAVSADTLTEGAETITVTLDAADENGVTAGLSASSAINDTSLTNFTITYDPNIQPSNLTGSGFTTTHADGSTATIASPSFGANNGWVFNYWSPFNTGGSPNYNPGDTLTVNGDITLYAIWTQPSYTSLSASPSAVTDEGQNVTVILSGADVPNGRTVDWTITGVDGGDISGALTGTFTMNGDQAQYLISINNDNLTEGTETLTFTCAAADNGGTSNGLSLDITINDTSLDPISNYNVTYQVQPGPSYTITGSHPNSVSYADGTTFTVAGPTWSVAGYTFDGYAESSNLNASITVQPGDQLTINGADVDLYARYTPIPTYGVFQGPATRLEGQTATYVLNSTDVADGTTVGYTITGVDLSDISLNSLTGTITMNDFMGNQQAGQLQFTCLNDNITDGPDTMVVTLDNADSAGNTTGLPKSVSTTITDVTYLVNTTFNHPQGFTNHTLQTVNGSVINNVSHLLSDSGVAGGSNVDHTMKLIANAGWEFDFNNLDIGYPTASIDLNNQPAGVTITEVSATEITITRSYTNIQTNASSTFNMNAVPMLQVFDCNYAGLTININNGTVGDAVNFSVSIDGNPPANLPGINPATYQNGTTTYDVTFDIPAGFANSGQITCQASGTGTAPQLNRTLYYFHAGQSTVPYAADMTAAGTTFYINGGNGTSTDLSVAMQDIIANSGNQYYGTVSSFTMPQGTNITANGNATQWTYPTTTVSEPYYIAVPDNADFPEDLLTGNHLVDLGNNQPTNASSMATFTDANGENYKLYKLAAASGIGGPTYSFV